MVGRKKGGAASNRAGKFAGLEGGKAEGSWRQPSIDCQPGQPTNLTRTFLLSSSLFRYCRALLFLLLLLLLLEYFDTYLCFEYSKDWEESSSSLKKQQSRKLLGLFVIADRAKFGWVNSTVYTFERGGGRFCRNDRSSFRGISSRGDRKP